jgi:site-specific recombinase XerD
MKRFEHPKLEFLSREERLAPIGSPGTSWISRRDHFLLGLLYNTGARVSEIIHVKVADIVFDGVACVHLHGKGRKHRAVPLWKSTIQEIRAWLRLNPQMEDDSALLPNRDGQAMTRNNVAQRVSLAATAASQTNTSLSRRHISPHCIRHASAMHLLQSGVDISMIALWLGHESPKTTYTLSGKVFGFRIPPKIGFLGIKNRKLDHVEYIFVNQRATQNHRRSLTQCRNGGSSRLPKAFSGRS